MVTEFEVHTAFGRSMRLWADLGLTNQIASLAIMIFIDFSIIIISDVDFIKKH